MANKVTGIGGVFFRAKDPAKLGEWYAKNFNFELENGMQMTTFPWKRADDPSQDGMTVWNLFPQDTKASSIL